MFLSEKCRPPVMPGVSRREWLAQPIHWRRIPVDLAQVIVEEIDVAAGDLERRRAVAEDALQAEHVTAVL